MFRNCSFGTSATRRLLIGKQGQRRFRVHRGDPSDKLPGAAGVGPKRAAQLVQRYRTLDGVLEAGLFKTQAEMLRLYRLIATMDAKAPLPSLADQEPTWGSASTFTRDWGLNQLADRLGEMA